MKELNLEQMENVEGGVLCAVIGVSLGMLFTPIVGVSAGILCNITYGAYPAY